MDDRILEFLSSQRVGVLALVLPDGTVHGATLHYAHTDEPLACYFLTEAATRKAQAFESNLSVKASFVIGTDETTMKTLQMDGVVEKLSTSEYELFDAVYLGKFASKSEKAKSPTGLRLKFTPLWWRYTDFKSLQGKLILSSR